MCPASGRFVWVISGVGPTAGPVAVRKEKKEKIDV